MKDPKSIKQFIKEGKEALRYLRSEGIDIDLDNWISVREYVKRFHLKDESVVKDWVRRGIIPPDHVDFEKPNTIWAIKAVPYADRGIGR
ncbi:hypothetical protein [Larkinella rosea]|uniref:Uncharacterized protein n=1 Tax=Larkinella rosea TaxID=2025312 RepID=A0A3P1C381_9BACT|nr:hypothetical protein [Larkinella rosea]RRB07850.1 hypothetical protein EHT25_08760 [Larkinella rosea]